MHILVRPLFRNINNWNVTFSAICLNINEKLKNHTNSFKLSQFIFIKRNLRLSQLILNHGIPECHTSEA